MSVLLCLWQRYTSLWQLLRENAFAMMSVSYFFAIKCLCLTFLQHKLMVLYSASREKMFLTNMHIIFLKAFKRSILSAISFLHTRLIIGTSSWPDSEVCQVKQMSTAAEGIFVTTNVTYFVHECAQRACLNAPKISRSDIFLLVIYLFCFLGCPLQKIPQSVKSLRFNLPIGFDRQTMKLWNCQNLQAMS